MKFNFISRVFSKESSKTRIMTNPIFFKHHISPDHPETPERIKYILELLKKKNEIRNLLENVNVNFEIDEWILKIHTKKHIESLRRMFPLAEKVSSAAIKVCITALNEIMNKKIKNVFCAVRPPGHHALNTGKEEGFCYYNHIAILAKYAQQKYNLKKILIVDWDYHHGNSTEHFFYDDPSILFFSTHDAVAYPGTGSPTKKGTGDGYGFNINVHLPCGTNDKKIIDSFNNILLPKVKIFKPDLVLISSGFDSRIDDLLGCFKITDKGFQKLTEIVLGIAKKHSQNRLISVLEGGYNLTGNAKATIAHVKTLKKFN